MIFKNLKRDLFLTLMVSLVLFAQGCTPLWKQDTETVRKKAEAGDAKAEAELGRRYLQGIYVIENDKEALAWNQKAADKNNSQGEWGLGSAYWFGKGVSKDISKAIYWDQKAADQNDIHAESDLGMIYWREKGIKHDTSKAIYWFKKAANQNIPEMSFMAQDNLVDVYFEEGKFMEAFPWVKKMAEAGSDVMQAQLGEMYANGSGTDQNFEEAAKWYERSAKRGNQEAKRMLEELPTSEEKNSSYGLDLLFKLIVVFVSSLAFWGIIRLFNKSRNESYLPHLVQNELNKMSKEL